jgi:hypothetical protein
MRSNISIQNCQQSSFNKQNTLQVPSIGNAKRNNSQHIFLRKSNTSALSSGARVEAIEQFISENTSDVNDMKLINKK